MKRWEWGCLLFIVMPLAGVVAFIVLALITNPWD